MSKIKTPDSRLTDNNLDWLTITPEREPPDIKVVALTGEVSKEGIPFVRKVKHDDKLEGTIAGLERQISTGKSLSGEILSPARIEASKKVLADLRAEQLGTITEGIGRNKKKVGNQMNRDEYETAVKSLGGKPISDRELYESLTMNWDSDFEPNESEKKLLALNRERRATLYSKFGIYAQRVGIQNTHLAYKSVNRDGVELLVVDNLPNAPARKPGPYHFGGYSSHENVNDEKGFG